ncbi:hypothetical protein Tsubulata_020020 [Turnera subulata]|uniref:MBD domain-containing protein n=1 Tax=Turnera subulata TaxID=218843 RepID=A0A9Q0G6W7_9ROSI|nr:hypothetical protein Tsubulata_020020 [Turnera subulata]
MGTAGSKFYHGLDVLPLTEKKNTPSKFRRRYHVSTDQSAKMATYKKKPGSRAQELLQSPWPDWYYLCGFRLLPCVISYFNEPPSIFRSNVKYYLCQETGQHFYNYEDLIRYVDHAKETKISIYSPVSLNRFSQDFVASKLKNESEHCYRNALPRQSLQSSATSQGEKDFDLVETTNLEVSNFQKGESSGKDTILSPEHLGASRLETETSNVVTTDQFPEPGETKRNAQPSNELGADPEQPRPPARDFRFTYFRKRPYARLRQALFNRVEALPIKDVDMSFLGKLEKLIA